MLRSSGRGTPAVLLPQPAAFPPRCLNPGKGLTHPRAERGRYESQNYLSAGHLYEPSGNIFGRRCSTNNDTVQLRSVFRCREEAAKCSPEADPDVF